jgi:hypothetical protein
MFDLIVFNLCSYDTVQYIYEYEYVYGSISVDLTPTPMRTATMEQSSNGAELNGMECVRTVSLTNDVHSNVGGKQTRNTIMQ